MLLSKLLDFASLPDIPISQLALDSRLVQPGALFFAFPGSQLDGRAYIDQAIKKGAAAVVVESDDLVVSWRDQIPLIPIAHLQTKIGNIAARFFDYPATKMPIIGITGTNGKTSCSHFIADSLQQLGLPCGIVGTLGNGLYGQIKSGSLTTPDAITLQQLFADFLKAGAKYTAMEVSSHSLDQGRVNNIEFAVGVFTNLTRDHLDYHGTMENYGAAKKRLFAQSQFAVINRDDTFGKELIRDFANKTNLLSYSLDMIDELKLTAQGLEGRVTTEFGQGSFRTSLIGQFNLSNLLAVITTLCLLDIPLATVLDCVANIKSVPGRMQVLGGQNKPLVIVDYAHTPDALEKVLVALKQHCRGKLYCVFGCGGDRDRGKRPLMAKTVEQYADHIIVTDDNPRLEDPAQIVSDILKGFSSPETIIIEHDRSKAIHNVIQWASLEDCILIAGKGAETYQQIGNEKIPFSDVESVNASLA